MAWADVDGELQQAETQTSVHLSGPYRYRFQVYRWGQQTPDPVDFRRVLVEIREPVTLYVDLVHVLLQREGGE